MNKSVCIEHKWEMCRKLCCCMRVSTTHSNNKKVESYVFFVCTHVLHSASMFFCDVLRLMLRTDAVGLKIKLSGPPCGALCGHNCCPDQVTS